MNSKEKQEILKTLPFRLRRGLMKNEVPKFWEKFPEDEPENTLWFAASYFIRHSFVREIRFGIKLKKNIKSKKKAYIKARYMAYLSDKRSKFWGINDSDNTGIVWQIGEMKDFKKEFNE